MKTALFTGSFDPVTKGHLDLIKRSSEIFHKVIVGVGINPTKKYTFSIEQRVNFIKHNTLMLKNVEVLAMEDGKLSADMAYEHQAVIIKGVRINADFDYERLMDDINKLHCRGVDTMIFPCRPELSHVSSSATKEVCKLNGNTEDFVTLGVKDALEQSNGQFRIGLTGSIASGKSTLMREIEKKLGDKVFNVDLDIIAHDILFLRIEPIYLKIRSDLQTKFGISEWNKRSLAEVIFTDPTKREYLNSSIRQSIFTRIRSELHNKKGLIVFNSALLVEADMLDFVNNNVVFTRTPYEVQLERLLKRGHDRNQCVQRLNSQLSYDSKMERALDKIDNDRYGKVITIDTYETPESELCVVVDLILKFFNYDIKHE
jgi:pantetheine-phosphate adenylyltransferase